MERDGGREGSGRGADDGFEERLWREGHDLASSGIRENAAKGAIVSDGGVAEFHRTRHCLQATIAAAASIKCGSASLLDVGDA